MDFEVGEGRGVVFGVRGEAVADYRVGDRGGRPAALDLRRRGGVAPAVVADGVVAALPGWVVAADVEVAQCLVAAGGRAGRHLHGYAYDLGRDVDVDVAAAEVAVGFGTRPVGAVSWHELYDMWVAAYPPGHPDHVEPVEPRGLAGLFEGDVLGPLLACGAVAFDDGRPVGAVIVNDAEVIGPWVGEVFRDAGARYAGLGARLLRYVLARAARDGVSKIGLAVTEGNPARRVYERIGFRQTGTVLYVLVPGGGALKGA